MTRRLRLSLTLTAAALAASVMLADERVGAEQTAPPSGQGAVTQGQPGMPPGRGEGGRAGGRAVQPRTRKALLAWADTRNGIAQHAFTSHALAVIERLGYETGLWDTFIRTDSNIIFDQAQKTDGSPASGGPSLSNVDGIFFLGHRDVPINDQQKAELLAFVRSGKGFVAAHTGLTAFESWPEFGEMLGATYGGHLYTGPGRVVSEQPGNPIVKHLGGSFDYNDEFYKAQAFSREKIDVLLRFLPASAPTSNLPADGDFPLVWAKTYGQGRVVYSSFSHATEAWDTRSLQVLMLEAIKWSLGLSEAPVQPHLKREGGN